MATALKEIPELATAGSMRLIARALAAGRLEVHATGMENLPVDGPALLVARHYHHLFDGLALFAAIARPLHILVAVDWAQTAAVRWLIEALAGVARWPLVLRTDGLLENQRRRRPAQKRLFSLNDIAPYQKSALRDSVTLLLEGRLLVVFPEGYPNIDPHFTPKTAPDQFLPFKSGFAAIAVAAEKRLGRPLPLIPVGLHYEPGKRWIAFLRFGKRIYANEFDSRADLIRRLETEVCKHLLARNPEFKVKARVEAGIVGHLTLTSTQPVFAMRASRLRSLQSCSRRL